MVRTLNSERARTMNSSLRARGGTKKKAGAAKGGAGKGRAVERAAEEGRAPTELEAERDKRVGQAVLQALLRRGLMAYSDFAALKRRILTETGNQGSRYSRGSPSQDPLVSDLNRALKPVQLKIKVLPSPVSADGHRLRDVPVADRVYYVSCVNMVADGPAKALGSAFSVQAIALFREVLRLIARDEGGSVDGAEALNVDVRALLKARANGVQVYEHSGTVGETVLSDKDLKMNMGAKERALRELCEAGWLAKTPGRTGAFSIGPRSFMELRNFLLQQPDLPAGVKADWESFL